MTAFPGKKFPSKLLSDHSLDPYCIKFDQQARKNVRLVGNVASIVLNDFIYRGRNDSKNFYKVILRSTSHYYSSRSVQRLATTSLLTCRDTRRFRTEIPSPKWILKRKLLIGEDQRRLRRKDLHALTSGTQTVWRFSPAMRAVVGCRLNSQGGFRFEFRELISQLSAKLRNSNKWECIIQYNLGILSFRGNCGTPPRLVFAFVDREIH